MPFTVLKISRADPERIDVIGEFNEEHKACEFADQMMAHDKSGNYEYSVEAPISRSAEHDPRRSNIFSVSAKSGFGGRKKRTISTNGASFGPRNFGSLD
jgi:hypothetical protein